MVLGNLSQKNIAKESGFFSISYVENSKQKTRWVGQDDTVIVMPGNKAWTCSPAPCTGQILLHVPATKQHNSKRHSFPFTKPRFFMKQRNKIWFIQWLTSGVIWLLTSIVPTQAKEQQRMPKHPEYSPCWVCLFGWRLVLTLTQAGWKQQDPQLRASHAADSPSQY